MNTLRDKALRARREMTAEARATSSEKICRRVLQSREFRAARTLSCYLPMADEVNPLEIIERGWRANKRIFVPVLFGDGKMSFRELRHETTLRRNSYGIWEPESGDYISPRNLNLVLTPTVAYDENNHRIGMGGGYYDRCFSFLRLRKHWLQPKLIGLAFACQKVEKITPNVWDIRLYGLISDNH
ncbi:MAG: 5-formyltetrahydrofolate cyclo-ligase [Woeseiaceae bacterium]